MFFKLKARQNGNEGANDSGALPFFKKRRATKPQGTPPWWRQSR